MNNNAVAIFRATYFDGCSESEYTWNMVHSRKMKQPPPRPSQVLRAFYPNHRVGFEVLSKYANDVIQHDYPKIIIWGLCRFSTEESIQDVIQFLRRWYDAPDTDLTIRDEFEKKLIETVPRHDHWDSLIIINQAFPDIAHDLVHECIRDGMQRITSYNKSFEDPFTDWLMKLYWPVNDQSDQQVIPCFELLVWKAFLESGRLAKYVKAATKETIETLTQVLSVLEMRDKGAFEDKKSLYLSELMERVVWESKQLLETGEPSRSTLFETNHRKCYTDDTYYQYRAWRDILNNLVNENSARDVNEKGQLLLHVMLENGIPGIDVVFGKNEKAAVTICPVNHLYPFQLAAKKREYGPEAAQDESSMSSLDCEQISQIYLLLRVKPEFVKPTKCEETLLSKEEFRNDIRACISQQKKLQELRAELHEMEAAVEAKKAEIDKDEVVLSNNRKRAYACLEE